MQGTVTMLREPAAMADFKKRNQSIATQKSLVFISDPHVKKSFFEIKGHVLDLNLIAQDMAYFISRRNGK